MTFWQSVIVFSLLGLILVALGLIWWAVLELTIKLTWNNDYHHVGGGAE